MHCNTMSLTNRFDRLREFLKKFPVMPHLIAITETRLKTSSNLQSINLPLYTFYHADSLTLAGGVGVYIKDNLQFKVRSDLKFCNEGCENFWIELVPTKASTNFNNKQKTSSSATLIDHFYTNDITNCSNCFIIRSDISDHFPLVVEIQQTNMMRPQKSAVTFIRSFRNFNDQDFCMEVQHYCRKLIGASQTVDEKVDTLISRSGVLEDVLEDTF